MGVREKFGLKWRLEEAFRAFTTLLTLSLLGMVVDFVILMVAGSIALMADLLLCIH